MPDNACLITNEWGYLNGCSTLSSISETVQKAVTWLGEEPQLGGTPAPLSSRTPVESSPCLEQTRCVSLVMILQTWR